MPAYSPNDSTILIIDDDVNLIRMLSHILKDFGRVLFAVDGEQGLEIAKKHKPDLILLDVGMLPLDGYEVCRRLKNDDATSKSAIIFVTANTGMDTEIACLDAGAVDFITKPLNPPVVQARVRTHLRLQHDSAALERLAQYDALTGLYNRRYFDKALEAEYNRLQRHQLPLGIALIDIDFFKKYNDTYGHLAGDAALKAVAHVIEAATKRPAEFVARYGGEEFVVVLPQTDEQTLKQYGQMICDEVLALKIPHDTSDIFQNITISVGLAHAIPTVDSSPQTLVDRADQALYRAKTLGRNRCEISSA
ncbi:GGDEF domain-containing response regulator [Undibacterium macrobrachii]|uniref:diguanylate cyclase n=1 Tax=Undibacterium macrobrachii TaxID=1119058 RepID=A0ABQ2XF49_9BURK|nr:diguanylate cyclase [Undibacterium macrobrachii]GGX13556.1 diguanylate cyclase response regulator [Undibacterium macrobrachii]